MTIAAPSSCPLERLRRITVHSPNLYQKNRFHAALNAAWVKSGPCRRSTGRSMSSHIQASAAAHGSAAELTSMTAMGPLLQLFDMLLRLVAMRHYFSRTPFCH